MKKSSLPICMSAITAVFIAGCSKNSPTSSIEETYNPVIDPSNFVQTIDNQYFPLIPGTTFLYDGQADEGVETNKVLVTHETKVIMGVTCTVIVDSVWREDELREATFDWYAQDVDGNVWYFGEDVHNFENGVLVDNAGSWVAGIGEGKPGIIMKANPQVGEIYRQEFDPGVVEDMGEVLSLNAMVTVAHGTFENCLRTRDWTPIEPGVTGHKFYAPGVGFILEIFVEGKSDRNELVEIQPDELYNPLIDPADFVQSIDNQYFPMTPGTIFTYNGQGEAGVETIKMSVTSETKAVMGVTCAVISDSAWLEGELIEATFDWYAQDIDGNVWYFGEAVDNFENGVLVNHNGSWEGGVDGALPGIIMQADLQIGESYRQEYYAGKAEDMGEVASLDESLTVPYGSFQGCLKTRDWNPLEPDVEAHKYYAPGIGFVLEVKCIGGPDRVELVDISMGGRNQ